MSYVRIINFYLLKIVILFINIRCTRIYLLTYRIIAITICTSKIAIPSAYAVPSLAALSCVALVPRGRSVI